MSFFIEFGLVIILASALAYVAKKMNQPLILAYIVAGIILGPLVLNAVKNLEVISMLAEFGIIFLLFMVGLEMNYNEVKEVGRVSLLVALGQVFFTFLVGAVLLTLFNFGLMETIYLGIALTFSSTIIVIQVISNKNDLNSLYGKICLGVLLFQDIVAIFALIFLANFGSGADLTVIFFSTIFKTIVIFVLLILLTKYVIPRIFDSIAKSREVLFLSSIGICFLFAIATEFFGLSLEIGSFLAGVALASMPYSADISSRVKPLKEFFLVVFFVALGIQMLWLPLDKVLIPILVLFGFVLIGNPIIVFLIMSALGYTNRTAFFSGISLAQISEFSLVLVALGAKLGHLTQETVAMVTVIGILTMVVSVYLMNYSEQIYDLIEKFLPKRKKENLIEKALHAPDCIPNCLTNHVVLFGYHRIGYSIVKKLEQEKEEVVIVDFNPKIIKDLLKEGKNCIFGDMGDSEVLTQANVTDAKIVISTVPSLHDNMQMIKRVKEKNKDGLLMVVAEHIDDAIELYNAGANYVILPYFLGGDHAALILNDFLKDPKNTKKCTKNYLENLKIKKQLGHQYTGDR